MSGTLAVRWMDTKEVLLLSKFHTNKVGEVMKKQRDMIPALMLSDVTDKLWVAWIEQTRWLVCMK